MAKCPKHMTVLNAAQRCYWCDVEAGRIVEPPVRVQRPRLRTEGKKEPPEPTVKWELTPSDKRFLRGLRIVSE